MDWIPLYRVILSVEYLTVVLFSKSYLKYFLICLYCVHLYNFIYRNLNNPFARFMIRRPRSYVVHNRLAREV